MLKAICDVQRTILESPRGIVDKDEFFDNKVEHLQSLGKQERDEILTLELKRFFGNYLFHQNFLSRYFKKSWIMTLLLLKIFNKDAGKIFW